MKKRLLTLIAITLCCSFCLVGCGTNSNSWTKSYKAYKALTLGATTEYHLAEGLTHIENWGDADLITNLTADGFVVVKNSEDKLGVWSVTENRLVVECKYDTDVFDFLNLDALYPYIQVHEPATEEKDAFYTIYDAKGNVIYTDIKTIGGTFFREYNKASYEYFAYTTLEDEEVAVMVKVTGFGTANRQELINTKEEKGTALGAARESVYFLTNTLEGLEYLYTTKTNVDGTTTLTFYNLKGKQVGSLTIDDGLTANLYFANQYIYYQEIVGLPFDATKYDLYNAGTKYTVQTYAFNFTNGKTTKLDLKGFITDISYATAVANESAPAFIEADRVKDKVAVAGQSDYYLAIEGKLIKTANTFSKAVKCGKNYILYQTNQITIVDGNGKEKFAFNTNNEFQLATYTDKVLALRDKRAGSPTYGKVALADFDGKLLTSFDYNGIYTMINGKFKTTKTVVTVNSENKNVTTNTYFAIDEKGAATEIATTTQVEGEAKVYKFGDTEVEKIEVTYLGYTVITKADDKYNITAYAQDGTKLFEQTGLDEYYSTVYHFCRVPGTEEIKAFVGNEHCAYVVNCNLDFSTARLAALI